MKATRFATRLLLAVALMASLLGGIPAKVGALQLQTGGTVWHVRAAAQGGNNGSTWADAYTDLQPVLAIANPGDQVWVAAGTYKPTSGTDRTATFSLKNGMAIYGGFAGTETSLSQRDWRTNVTTLDGNGAYHVVTAPAGTDSTAVLDGFTVTGGNANGSDPDSYGGAMLVRGTAASHSSPSVSKITFLRNQANYGGGLYVEYGSPTVTNAAFYGNTARSGGGTYVGYGAASPTLVNAAFSGNYASMGAAIDVHYNSATLINATFSGNQTSLSGGSTVTLSSAGASLALENSVVWGNPAGQILDPSGKAAIQFSDVQDRGGGGSNIDADPRFVRAPSAGDDGKWGTSDDDYGDLRLKSGSPAVDKGWSNLVPGGVTSDLAGFPRKADGDGNWQADVDMGAYERLTRIYVKSGGTGDGTTLSAVLPDLQSALALARPLSSDASERVEIWVGPGAYRPTSGTDRSATFHLKSNVLLRGGLVAGGDTWSRFDSNPATNGTVLSGDIGVSGDNSDNSYHVVNASGADGTAQLTGFTITGGNANGTTPDDCGGGLYSSGGSPALIGVIVSGNSASASGGGMWTGNGSPTLTNVVFWGNSAANGGGLSVASGSPALGDVTFNGNTGGGVGVAGGTPSIANSILWGNTGSQISGSGATVSYTDVQGGWSGTGNKDADPLFANAGGGNLNLSAGSPAIDVGSNALVPAGVTTDLAGLPRFHDDPGVLPNVASGITPPVDMGAYEFQAGSPVAWQTIYVKAGAAGQNTGASWTDAFTELNTALQVATSGQEVHVAAGTYTPTSPQQINHNATFQMKPGVKIYGGYPSGGGDTRDSVANVTTLSGDVGGNDTASDSINDSKRSDNVYHVVTAPAGLDSTAVLDGFTVIGGHANEGDDSQGGGMYVVGSSPTVSHVTFSGNMAALGGGMYTATGSSPALTKVAFSSNLASGATGGGGLYIAGGNPTLTDVIFTGNSAIDVVVGGGALYVDHGNPILANVVFTGNRAEESLGGAIYNEGGSPTLTGVTIVGNDAADGGAICTAGGLGWTLTNSILWGNTGSQISSDGGVAVSYSDVQQTTGQYAGTGNLNADPKFVSASDLHLQSDSPAINKGSNAAQPTGINTDLDGNTRVVGGTVDMGAYEYQATTPVASASDSTVGASPTAVAADGTSSATITVTLKYANGSVVSGKNVSLSQGSGSSTISPLSGVSDANGQVTFTVKDATVEQVTYTAIDTTDNVTVAQTASVSFTAGAVSADKSTVGASPISVLADGATASTITVTLRDASNSPISSKTVSLAAGSGSSTISAASGPSDQNGQVTFTVKDATVEQVTYTATDTTDNVTVAQTASVAFIGAPIVTSPTATNLTDTAATLGGNATSDSGVAVTERGIVYAPTATNRNPVIGGTGVTKVAAASGGTGSFTVNVSGLTPNTGYSFKAYAINSIGTSYSTVATFRTAIAARLHGNGAANPSTVAQGGTSLLTVAVGPAGNPLSTGIAVVADLRSIGGGSKQTFYDDGTHGDTTAHDNIFAVSATVGSVVSTGSKSLPFTITDAQKRSYTGSIGLTVTPAPVAPAVTRQPVSQSVVVGSDVTFTAAASGYPTPTVQWWVSMNNGANWQPISGVPSASTTTLHLSSVTGNQNGWRYRAVFTNSSGSVTTNAVVLTVRPRPHRG